MATDWSRALMAKAAGISPSSVGRIWRRHGLKLHRVTGFKISRDPKFTEKLEAIVGLYLNPPQKALVLCVLSTCQSRHSHQEWLRFLKLIDAQTPSDPPN
jgi:hypothetical protein